MQKKKEQHSDTKKRKKRDSKDRATNQAKMQEHVMKEFDDGLFNMTVENIEITKEHDIIFCLYNGLRLEERNNVEEKGW